MTVNTFAGTRRLLVALAATTAFAAPSTHAADLQGDTLSFLRAFPNTTTQYGQAIPDATVVVGTSDQVSWRFQANGPVLMFINPEPDRIIFTFPVAFGTGGTSTSFDGFVISGFDQDIVSRSLMNNPLGGTVLLGGGSRTLTMNMNGQFAGGQSFAVAISVVPEPAPAASMLLGAGVIGFVRWRSAARRK